MKRNTLYPLLICVTPLHSLLQTMMSSTTIVPPIDILALDYYGRRKFVRPTVKFTLRNIANDECSATHKQLVTIFTSEYGNANAKFYCLFEGMMRDVFERKPCPTDPSKFGIFTLCLRSTVMRAWIAAHAEVFNGDSIQEVYVTFLFLRSLSTNLSKND